MHSTYEIFKEISQIIFTIGILPLELEPNGIPHSTPGAISQMEPDAALLYIHVWRPFFSYPPAVLDIIGLSK